MISHQYKCLVLRCALAACLVWCIPGTDCRADDAAIDFDYDIFIQRDTLTVWLDVTPVLTQALLEDLLAGLQIRIDVRYKAEYPPDPIFAETIQERQRSVFLRRDVTGDFYELIEVNGFQDTVLFSSQLDMADYLTDSLELQLLPISRVEDDRKMRLKLEINSKSMIYKNLSKDLRSQVQSSEDEDEAGGQAVNTVFSYFLDVIGFGERKYQIRTPGFKISSLDSYPRQD
ncbi:MAG: hypothetical protein R3F48_05005 [Candidatus Zixiibacteriota bacterium]